MTIDVTKRDRDNDALSLSASSDATRAVLRNTYMLLAATLGTTAITAFISQLMGSPRINIIVLLVGFYGLMYLINRNRNSGAGIALTFVFSGFMGFSLGPILNNMLSLQNGASLITNAFLLTTLAFGALSLYAMNAKRDLSGLGSFLTVGAVVLIGGVILSLFTHISGLSMALSVGFVLFSSAAILYETNNIVRGGETNYILATVSLYVSVYNLFLSLLSLFGVGSKE